MKIKKKSWRIYFFSYFIQLIHYTTSNYIKCIIIISIFNHNYPCFLYQIFQKTKKYTRRKKRGNKTIKAISFHLHKAINPYKTKKKIVIKIIKSRCD